MTKIDANLPTNEAYHDLFLTKVQWTNSSLLSHDINVIHETAEYKLWRDVLNRLVRDIHILRRKYENATNGHCKQYLDELEFLRHTVNSEWIGQVCLYCDRDHNIFKDRMNKCIDGTMKIDITWL